MQNPDVKQGEGLLIGIAIPLNQKSCWISRTYSNERILSLGKP